MLVANTFVGLGAVLQAGSLLFETFFRDYPVGRKTFQIIPQFSKDSAVCAASQASYVQTPPAFVALCAVYSAR